MSLPTAQRGLPKITWGVGATLTSPDGLSSIFFQPGDDLEAFEDDFWALERLLSPDAALREAWGLYGHLAQPIDTTSTDERIAA